MGIATLIVLLLLGAAIIVAFLVTRKIGQFRRKATVDADREASVAADTKAASQTVTPPSPEEPGPEPTKPQATDTAQHRGIEPPLVVPVARGELKQETAETRLPRPQAIRDETKRLAEKGSVSPQGGQSRKPQERGGRPRTPLSEGSRQCHSSKRDITKPEIICHKMERQWILLIELPDELLEKPDLEVLQDDKFLLIDTFFENSWVIKQIQDKIVVCWTEQDNKQHIQIDLNKQYLLFKLSARNSETGRLVRRPSHGSYLVIVPDSWERDETISGPPFITPEPTSLEGYQAHFFELDDVSGGQIGFRDAKGNPVKITPIQQRFELIGTCLNDASEEMGPLFGQNPPRIRASGEGWSGISTIVLGEEGAGKGRWRMAFSPNPVDIEQTLPSELANRKSGWYFLRFYDTNDDLIESLDFRFISALKEIKIHLKSSFPLQGGHKPVTVELVHEDGCSVKPADRRDRNIQVIPEDGKTSLIIPPTPTSDKSIWHGHPEGTPPVEVTILVERVWWALGEEGSEPIDWQDQIIKLNREDFLATSKKALWLRLPKPRWVDKVSVGFEQARARPYQVKVTESTLCILLREFTDAQELRQGTQNHSLSIWIEKDEKPVGCTVAILQAWQQPIICSGCGRYKTAVAIAELRKGNGLIKVNGESIEKYFQQGPQNGKQFLNRLRELHKVKQILKQMEVNIKVEGSTPGTLRQIKASVHALARALMIYEPCLRPILRRNGFGGAKPNKGLTKEGDKK